MYMALNGLDRKLEKYIGYEHGTFIEAGANDGISQSNTFYYEKVLGWTGLLVEAIPSLAEACKHNRPGSVVENCALVSHDYNKPTIRMTYCNLMSLVNGAMGSEEKDKEHVLAGEACQGIKSHEIEVPASTLDAVLLNKCSFTAIDLFSLDVEGYELEVLRGFSLNIYRPKYILIETRKKDEVDAYLKGLYEPIDMLSFHDVLYAVTK